MQSKGFIKLIAGLLILACVYQLSFTFVTRNVESKAEVYAAQRPDDPTAEQHFLDSVMKETVYNLGFTSFNYKQCKEKELNLGLDLKGGMNVMLEVQVEDVIVALAGDNAKDPAFVEAMASVDKKTTKDFISDFAAAFIAKANRPLAEIFVNPDRRDINLNSSNEEVIEVLKQDTEAAIDASFKVLRSRIDNFGVTQPNILRLPNSNRILVELPGVKEPERVRKLLRGTASLEFWTTYEFGELQNSLARVDAYLRDELKHTAAPAEQAAEAETEEVAAPAEKSLAEEVAEAKAEESAEASIDGFDREENPLFALLDPRFVQFGGSATVGAAYKADMPAIDKLLARPDVRAMLPADLEFKWGVKGDDHELLDGRFFLYAIRVTTPDGKAPLDGSFVTDAKEQFEQHGANAEVHMSMNLEGARRWGRLTGENLGKAIAVVLDGRVYSAPTVQSKIENGVSVITGDFSLQEAKDLANVLVSGKVPAPSKIIQDTVVGPSLGQESINAGLFSFLVAFILVLLYMGLFYKTAGWMSDIALLVNVFLLIGVLVSFGAVLTLPGIAGIVLTMGMAVDANVIIYERIKEELRSGKGLSLAIKEGFSKAYSAIIDGNLTTIITGIVLFVFGTGPVQGFATTLIIGIITSLFSAIFITRLMIEWIVAKRGQISFSRGWSERFLSNTHIDFLAKRKVSYTIAAVIIALSCVSFFTRGLNKGTEFTGGRAYVIRFDQPVKDDVVRAAVEKAFAAKTDADASSISTSVAQFGDANQVRVVTQYKFDDTSDEATKEVEMILYETLKGKEFFSYDISFDNFTNTQDDANGIVNADKIGPSIAHDMTMNAIYSILFSLLAIGLYITFRFRYWQWATGATSALAFNALLVIGLFSMLYGLLPFNLEVNQAFIAAILTIIGYAINDTVVVFDRIREYMGLYPKREFGENVNNAINSTLSRTINTSGTTLVTLLAIFFFGGETIRGFVFALTIGVVVGTAATIFIATPIAYDLMKKRMAKNLKK